MNTIQVNYDLKQPGRNYAAVEQYIKGHGTWAHPLKSLWLIRTEKGVAKVRDELKQHVDSNDRVLVFNVDLAVALGRSLGDLPGEGAADTRTSRRRRGDRQVTHLPLSRFGQPGVLHSHAGKRASWPQASRRA